MENLDLNNINWRSGRIVKSVRSASTAIFLLLSLWWSDSSEIDSVEYFNKCNSFPSDDIICLGWDKKNLVFDNIFKANISYQATFNHFSYHDNSIRGLYNSWHLIDNCDIKINTGSVWVFESISSSISINYQEFIDDMSDDLYNFFKILLLWFLWWWATWIDDLVIFSWLYFYANRIKEKLSVFWWFSLSVSVMISICLTYDLIVDTFEDLQILKFIMRTVPIILWGKVIKDEYFDKKKNENIEEYHWGHSLNVLFIAAFMWYFLNSSDDIFYNVWVISNIDDIWAYFWWNALWAASMVSVPIVLKKYLEYKEKNKKSDDISIKKDLSDVLNVDQPRLRAVAMIWVWIYLWFIALEDVDILFEFIDWLIS